jgi:hypothetical protein
MEYVASQNNFGLIDCSVATTPYSSRMDIGFICVLGGSIGCLGHRAGFAPKSIVEKVGGWQDLCGRVRSEGTCKGSTAILYAFVNSDYSHVPSLQDSFLDVGIRLCFGVAAVPVGKVLYLVMHSRNLLTPLDSTDAVLLPFTERGIQVLKMFINPLFFPMHFRNILQ